MNASPALNTLEFLGALSARLAHALSNHLSIVSGNLCVAAALQDDQEKVSAALQSAMKGANDAGMLISRFVDLRRTVGIEGGSITAAAALACISEWCTGRARWIACIPAELGPARDLQLRMPAEWLRYSLDAIADETKADSGTIAISFHPAKPPAALLLNLAFEMPGAKPVDWNAVRRDLANFRLTASYELIGQAGGKIECSVAPSGAHQLRIHLPLQS